MTHHSFLLRLWHEPHDEHSAELRITLIDPRSKQQRSFGTLIKLAAYLEGVANAELSSLNSHEETGVKNAMQHTEKS